MGLGACDRDPTGPAPGLFGVWELRTLNESTLPMQIAAFDDGRRVVLKSSTLRLLAEGAWGEISEVDSIFPGGRVRSVSLTRTGTWRALDRRQLQWGLGRL